MLDIFASYHCMQFQRKLIIQSQENVEKPHFGQDLGCVQRWVQPKFGPHDVFPITWLG